MNRLNLKPALFLSTLIISAACSEVKDPPADTLADFDIIGDADGIEETADIPITDGMDVPDVSDGNDQADPAPEEDGVSPDEICNGIDDNGDTVIDEGFDCPMGEETECTTTCGSIGRGVCGPDCTFPDPGDCDPPDETCNGLDDDCDAAADNGFDCAMGITVGCITDCGTPGTGLCSSSCELPTGEACSAGAEICNGMDDNCNGFPDETFDCVMGTEVTCETTCESTGAGICSSRCTLPDAEDCVPPDEECNGLDDDCDEVCDNGFTCCVGSSVPCTTPCDSEGASTCTASCEPGECSPPDEVCNGLDDDCDEVCDNGFTCCAGMAGECITSCGSTGFGTCSEACDWSECTPPAEVCNGLDDDCMAGCDNGFDCCLGVTGSCTNPVGVAGSRTCLAGCTWGECCAAEETCDNDYDDDCDTIPDNGCGGIPLDNCSSPGTVTIGGTTAGTNAGMTDDYAGSCGGSGGLDVVYTATLATSADMFIAVHSTTMNPVIYLSTTCGESLHCNDNAYSGVSSSVLILDSLAAGDYYLVVDSMDGSTGNFTIEIYTTTDWAQGDGCGSPKRLRDNVTGDTGDMADRYQPSCQSSDAEDEVFYFILESSQRVATDTCGEYWDTVLYYRDDCDSGPDLECNDDYCGDPEWEWQSWIRRDFPPGVYFLFVDGYSGVDGSFMLNVSGL